MSELLIPPLEELAGTTVDSLELIEDPGWEQRVENIVVILSASRSGSSVVYNALASADGIVAPAGEHEPWLFLSRNKYPFTASDELTELSEKELLLAMLRNDLIVRQPSVGAVEYLRLLRNRFTLRGLSLPADIEKEVVAMGNVEVPAHRHLVSIGYGAEPQKPAPQTIKELERSDLRYPIENPPHIDQPLGRLVEPNEIKDKTLLFKSPSDAYRPGFYEELFPNANISYVHLTRGYAQTINGLMDGWLSDGDEFISNGVGMDGAPLDIQGYSKDGHNEAYWCFDLFPDWDEHRTSDLLTICALQWVRAHRAILNNFTTDYRVRFDDLYGDKAHFIASLQASTGARIDPSVFDVPVMATHAPRRRRWQLREAVLTRIGELISFDVHSDLQEITTELGYSEDPSTWL